MKDDNDHALAHATQRRASVLRTFSAVAWSFFGVRRSAGFEHDVQKLNPVHLVVAGLVAAAGFVLVVLFFVRWVVSSGVAA